MTVHLLLLSHAASPSTRTASFALDDEAADAVHGRAPYSDRRFVSPAARAQETARALGLADAAVEPALAECDFGRWRGRSLAAVQAREPAAVAEWLSDPAARPHGGESFVDLIARTRSWLNVQAAARGVVLAVTHASVIRAAIVAALDAEPRAFWRIDVAPLALARLSGHAGRWNFAALGALEPER